MFIKIKCIIILLKYYVFYKTTVSTDKCYTLIFLKKKYYKLGDLNKTINKSKRLSSNKKI